MKKIISTILCVTLLFGAISLTANATEELNMNGMTGTFEKNGSDVTVKNIGGHNNNVMTDTFVTDFTLETDIKMDSGCDAGIIFNGPKRPIAPGEVGWIGMKINSLGGGKHRVRTFHEGNLGALDNRVELSAEASAVLNSGGAIHMKLVVSDGHIMAWFNNEAVATVDVNYAHAGGFVGFSTYNCQATFSNITFSSEAEELPELEGDMLKGITLEGATLNAEFKPSSAYYYATAPANAQNIKVKLDLAEGVRAYAGGEYLEDGEYVLAPHDKGFGYPDVDFTLIYGGVSRKFTLGVFKTLEGKEIYGTENRPRYHYTAAYGYINDPNGLIYDPYNKVYHMFYQHRPFTVGNSNEAHWGHAISYDLVSWKDMGSVLMPDDFGYMWSGSAIIDYNNDSGIYDESVPPENRLLIFYYIKPLDDSATVGIAYTTDGGSTWVKYNGGQPIGEFRSSHTDPKVFRLEKYNVWVLITASGELYTSDNLINWSFNSNIALSGVSDHFFWECPDYYEIKVEGTNEKKWVFTAAGSFYVVGDFKKIGNVIRFVQEQKPVKLNGGSHFFRGNSVGELKGQDAHLYATQHFYGAPDDRIISVSWLRNNGAGLDPTGTWSGTLTVPTEHKLVKMTDGTYLLTSYPIAELERLREGVLYQGSLTVGDGERNTLDGLKVSVADIEGSFVIGEGVTEFGIRLRASGEADSYIEVSYDVSSETLTVDLSKSRHASLNGSYTMPLEMKDGKVSLRVLLDTVALEVYGNGGEAATSVSYGRPANAEGIEIFSVGGSVSVEGLKIYEMGSIRDPHPASDTPIPDTSDDSDTSETTDTIEVGNDKKGDNNAVLLAVISALIGCVVALVAVFRRKKTEK